MAFQAASSLASRASEADGRLSKDLNVDNRACPGWGWEGVTRLASPARLGVGSGAEWSLEGSGVSCPLPGDAAAPAGPRGSFWSQSGCSSWRRLPGNSPSLPRTLHVMPASKESECPTGLRAREVLTPREGAALLQKGLWDSTQIRGQGNGRLQSFLL